MEEHWSVSLSKHILPNFDLEIGSHPEYVSVESGVVELAER
jgi:hypothetical protein